MPHPQPITMTVAEYLASELSAQVRHEYVAGQVFAMAGGNLRHNRIALNLASALLSGLKGKPCQVFMSDVKLHVARLDAYYYPDVMVSCSDVAKIADENQAVNDAVLVVEVLSPNTEAIDRREKLMAYRRLPGLLEYALVSQDVQQVEIYRRQGDINWLYLTYEPGDSVEFTSINLRLSLAELYTGTDLGV